MGGLLDIINQLSPAQRDQYLFADWQMQPVDDPLNYGRSPHVAAPAEMRSRPDGVWPSHGFWDGLGITDPAWHRRMAQAQTGLLSALDLFGIPSAIASRVAPEATAQHEQMKADNPNTSMGAALAGGLLGPMRGAYRMAGDAARARGYGLGAQMGADAGSAVGLLGTADVIRGDVPNADASSTLAGTAAGLRWLAPSGLPGLLSRTVMGAGAGAAANLPNAYAGEWDQLASGGAVGGLLGAAMRGQGGGVRPGAAGQAAGYLGPLGAVIVAKKKRKGEDDTSDQSAQARYPYGGY